MINHWVEELHNKTDVANLQLLLVGNKSDLEDRREISTTSGKEIADKLGILFCETSAKTYDATKGAFEALV